MSRSLTVESKPNTHGNVASAVFTIDGREFVAETTANVPLRQDVTAWLPPALLVAMKNGLELRPEGPVDPRFASNLAEAQGRLHQWNPDTLVPVAVHTTDRSDDSGPDGRRGVACFFSGGVDSFYSVLEHIDEITHLVFIHGFDITLRNCKLADRALRALRVAAADLGKILVEVRTDLRDLPDHHGLDWLYQSHGSILAHTALLLSDHIHKVYVPASGYRAPDKGHGTHPDLDRLWSTTAVDIVHDDIHVVRARKTEVVADNEIAMRHLRVCWQNNYNDYNCGRCEKCLRTLMNLRVAGAEGRCRTLPGRVPFDVFEKTYLTRSALVGVRTNLDELHRRGIADPELQEALERALRRPAWRNRLNFLRSLRGLVPSLAYFYWTRTVQRYTGRGGRS